MLVGHRDRRRAAGPRAAATRRAGHQLRHRARPRCSEHLRYLPHSRVPISCCPTPDCRHRRRRDALRPHGRGLGRHQTRFSAELRRAGRGRLLRHHARVHLRAARGRPRPIGPDARRGFEPSATSIYSAVTLTRTPAFLDHRRAHQRQRLEEVPRAMLDGRLGHLRRRWPRSRSGRARTSSTSASTTSGRDDTRDMDEIASRFATQVALPLVIDSTEPPVIEAGAPAVGGRAILNSANLEDGERQGAGLDRVFTLARDLRRRRDLPAHRRRRARPATASGSWRSRHAHPRPGRRAATACESAATCIFDTLTFPLSTGDDDLPQGRPWSTLRGHPPHQGEICPACSPCSACRNVSLRPLPGRTPRPELACSCTSACEAGLDSAIVHAPRSCRSTASRRAARRRASTSSTTGARGLRPAPS